jgi:hypothetical protein
MSQKAYEVMPRVARWFNFKPNSDKFVRALGWKRLIYFMTIWKILRTFGVYDHLVHIVFIWYILSGLGVMYEEKSGIHGDAPLSAKIGVDWSAANLLHLLASFLRQEKPALTIEI